MENSLTIIGGGTGLIGHHLVQRFSQSKQSVISMDNSEPDSQVRSAQYFDVDLSDENQVENTFKKIFADQKYTHCTLINCQGIADPTNGPLQELSLNQWNSYISNNLTSYFLTCREFIRNKESFESGAIINLSSTRHLMAEADTEAYCTTKGGITSFTKALAISLGNTSIRCNSVSPGWIAKPDFEGRPSDHKQHPAGRVGRPEDIFGLCQLLGDPTQDFITAQDFVIDGGMTSKMIYT